MPGPFWFTLGAENSSIHAEGDGILMNGTKTYLKMKVCAKKPGGLDLGWASWGVVALRKAYDASRWDDILHLESPIILFYWRISYHRLTSSVNLEQCSS